MEARALLDALNVAERLKDTTRHCYTKQGRHESVAEHSWMMNLVAIAWSKAGEVIASGANSGNPDRKKIMGELGFTGGAYAEGDDYKLAFAFSGATSEEDLEVAEYGIAKFKEYARAGQE